MRPKGLKYTGEESTRRKEARARRKEEKKSIEQGRQEELGELLPPKEFEKIQEAYWSCLRAVPDPRKESMVVYPLWLILHRIIHGFLTGSSSISPLFPKKHQGGSLEHQRLGGLPTVPAVHTLLRRVDWQAANQILSLLWEHLGYEKSIVIRRELREPEEILAEFEQAQAEQEKKRATSERKA